MKAKMLLFSLATALTLTSSASCIRVYYNESSDAQQASKTTKLFTKGNTTTSISNVSFNRNAKKTVNKEVSIPSFNKISVAQNIEVICDITNPSGKAKISTTAAGGKYLKVEVKNGELLIHYDLPNDFYKSKEELATTIHISANSLQEIELSSAASLTLNGDLKEKGDVSIELSSAASINAGNIECAKLEIEASSAGSFQAKTITANLDIESTSAAQIKIEALKGNLDIEATSGAQIKIETLKGNLDIEATSASQITIGNAIATETEIESTSASQIAISNLNSRKLKIEASSGSTVQANGTWESISQNATSEAKIRLNSK